MWFVGVNVMRSIVWPAADSAIGRKDPGLGSNVET